MWLPSVSSRNCGVSVVIPTLNESDRLGSCLAALRWADEVIVADGGSTDATPCIARSNGARVIEHAGGSIAAQRNAGIDAATHEWILAVDADERVTSELATSIRCELEAPAFDAYRVTLHNSYLGRPMTRGSWSRDRHVRLFRRRFRFREQRVHERLEFSGEAGTLSGALLHEPYRDLTHQLEKSVRYAKWGADDLAAHGRRASFVGDFLVRPAWRFAKMYVVQGLWREGRLGFVFSAVHAWAGFSKYAQLWYTEHAARQATAITRQGSTTLLGESRGQEHGLALVDDRGGVALET